MGDDERWGERGKVTKSRGELTNDTLAGIAQPPSWKNRRATAILHVHTAPVRAMHATGQDEGAQRCRRGGCGDGDGARRFRGL